MAPDAAAATGAAAAAMATARVGRVEYLVNAAQAVTSDAATVTPRRRPIRLRLSAIAAVGEMGTTVEHSDAEDQHAGQPLRGRSCRVGSTLTARAIQGRQLTGG
jgi:hypothetical protein